MDRLGMADGHRDAYTRRADRQIRDVEDLARLVDHLLLFAVHAVALVAADFGDDVEMDLVRVHVAWQRAATDMRRLCACNSSTARQPVPETA